MKNLAENFSTSLSQLLKGKATILAMADYSQSSFRSTSQTSPFQNRIASFKSFKRFFKRSPYIPFVLVGVVVLALVILVVRNVAARPDIPAGTLGSSTKANQIAIAKPLATETLHKNFDFPLRDANGKEVSKIHYEIQSAELDNQIVVKGQLATAVQGRAFLILNLKITNNYSKSVQLNTRDYVRLIVDNSSDRLAADVHNDPVDVEAISTKYTRIGFPIDVNAKNIKLEVGEIAGSKQTIALNLQ